MQTTGGHDVAALLDTAMRAFGAEPADGYGVFAAFAGYCLHSARLPPPANIPTMRAFQRAQGEALIRLLARGD